MRLGCAFLDERWNHLALEVNDSRSVSGRVETENVFDDHHQVDLAARAV